MDIIRIENAEKYFKDNKVLKDLSINFKKGMVYGIIGYNGSGKTVLFKCICGFLKLDKGKIFVNGAEMHKDINMLPDAGVIIEEPAFLKNCSAIKNLEYLYTIKNKPDKKHLYEILELVGLEPDNKKKVGRFSMGMKQRLAIAQAIMEDQSILILDEPMNGLDKNGVADMRKLFLDLKKQGKTIILASHMKDDIDVLCDEVYEMEAGSLSRVR